MFLVIYSIFSHLKKNHPLLYCACGSFRENDMHCRCHKYFICERWWTRLSFFFYHLHTPAHPHPEIEGSVLFRDSITSLSTESLPIINTYHAGFGFSEQNCVCFLTFSEILTAISRTNEPIPGMFVLIWMHFTLWFQIWSWNSKMLTFFTRGKH